MTRSAYRTAAALVVAVVMMAATMVLATENAPAPEKAKPLDGKELFKTSCKVCHGAKAEAGEYTPMTLIQEQWDEFFATKFAETHAEVAAPDAADKKLPEVLDAKTLEAIRKFCVDHAADSEQPMTCG